MAEVNPNAEPGMCACGEPLHYSNRQMEAWMRKIVEKEGEWLTIHVGGRSWRVQRHYVALHGIKATELPTLGFEEVLS